MWPPPFQLRYSSKKEKKRTVQFVCHSIFQLITLSRRETLTTNILQSSLIQHLFCTLQENSTDMNFPPTASMPPQAPRRFIGRYLLLTIAVAFVLFPAVLFVTAVTGHPRLVKIAYVPMHHLGLATVYIHPTNFPSPPYTLFSTRVLLPGLSSPVPAYLHVSSSGKFSVISRTLYGLPQHARIDLVDVSPDVLMAGMVDPHVHCNDPGTSAEGFSSATRAAAAGGTTTLLDMPLNTVPATTTVESMSIKMKALAESDAAVDVGLIGGVIPANVDEPGPLLDAGVVALKSFMIDSQSSNFPNVSPANLRRAIIAQDRFIRQRGLSARVPYILHAELDEEVAEESNRPFAVDDYDHTSYTAFEASRPASWETAAVQLALDSANDTMVHLHIAHVSAVEVLDLLRPAVGKDNNNDGPHITAETCPHYLLFAADELPAGATLHKCAPPIRAGGNRKRLLHALLSSPTNGGQRGLDSVVSDHSPSESVLKETGGNLTKAWGGVAGLQYRLMATWTAARAAGFSLGDMARVLSEAPAVTFGMGELKGALREGLDADVVIWDPERAEKLNAENCEHRHPESAYHGWTLDGVVQYTLLRGRLVFRRGLDGANVFELGFGRMVRKMQNGSVVTVDHSDA